MNRWVLGNAGRPPVPRLARGSVRTSVLAAALAAASLLVGARGASAQESGTISGVVAAVGTAEPLPGAQISVVGGTQRTVSGDRGTFRLTGITAPTVTLEVRRIGYRSARVTARNGQTDVRVALTVNPTSLEAVVVTGTTGAVEKRELGNSVTTIDAAATTQIAPVKSMQEMLNGRAPGVVIMPTSGAVGTGSQVRVRGIASLSLGNNPLLYVDGVRVNNENGGPQNQAFGSGSISRLNDINPEDIESIEVLKGPSAATLYGTEASNGVINIITKKGASGAPRWNAVVRQGVNYLQDWRGRFPTNYGPERLPQSQCPSAAACYSSTIVALNMDSLVKGNSGDVFRNGRHQETQLSVSGGTSLFNYYASGNLLDSQGAEPSNNTRKYSGRLNLGVSPSPKFRVSADMGYVTGPTNLSAEAGYGGRVWTTLYATPKTYNTWQHGFYSGLPWQYDQVYHLWEDLDRFTGSVKFEHTPVTWFQHRITLGLDRTDDNANYLFSRIDSLNQYPSFSGDALGLREIDQTATSYRSIDYAASGTWNPLSTLRAVSSVGAQYYHTGHNYFNAWGSVFPVPGLTSINATTQGKGQGQDADEGATLGYYGQEELGWRERLYLTAALRWDNSSAFGQNVNKVVYPKYSLSYVVSDEDFWKNNGLLSRLNSFRLRAAYGEAGKAPGTYDALRTFNVVTGPGDSPAVTPASIGNPNLGPERGKEYELGFDAAALSDRVNLEVTHYNKRTTDAILFRQVPPSEGFATSEPINAGALLNRGWETSLRVNAVHTDAVNWDWTFNYATNYNKVESLVGGLSFVTAGTNVRHAVGYPAYAWWQRQVVSAQVDSTGHGIKSTMKCNDGKGGAVSCYDANGNLTAPFVYLGRSVPPREGSISTSLSFLKYFTVYTQFDFKNGAKKLDGNTRIRCTLFGGRCPENFPQAFPANSLDPVREAEANSNGVFQDFYISSSNFTKWREFTLQYTLPDRITRLANTSRASISVSGRNLHTWTSFKGFEPEAMWLGGSRGGNTAWEQAMLPQLTSWIVTLNLGL